MAGFTVKYDMEERGLSTLFRYRIFTISAKDRQHWDYDRLEDYLGSYRLEISPKIIKKYEESSEIRLVLEEMTKETWFFEVDNNKANRYSGRKQYIRCSIPIFILGYLKKLFVSTLVYNAEKQQIPEGESIEFQFDASKKVVFISDLQLYRPMNNPFFRYASKAVSSLSVEAIGLEKYSLDADKDIKNFYDLAHIPIWKEREQLKNEFGIDDKPGIYMLYDAIDNLFYVGKATRLKERILQHMNTTSGDSPISNFTHYRYSAISGEYYELLYLIENAAIHDAAWILNMPSAQRYTSSLAKIAKEHGHSLNDCIMTNIQEYQTRRQ